jgi:DNA adenine methylase
MVEMKDISKPFVKWVGGKTQLLPHLSKIIQSIYPTGDIDSYVEPFIGGGALFFWLKSFMNINLAVIADINEDLVLAYEVVQQYPSSLINNLRQLEQNYQELNSTEREVMYYDIRRTFNIDKVDFNYSLKEPKKWSIRAAYLIFLNKTCFNGLFRQNSKGEFNVPFGKYKNPKICDEQNIINCSNALKGVKIVCGDFESTEKYMVENSLIYLDPPYKPISSTSSFTKYHKNDFNDAQQMRLARYCHRIDLLGAKIILSNSDPSSADNHNNFFDELYKNFDIDRVNVMRMVSARASSRSKVKELIIKNAGLI